MKMWNNLNSPKFPVSPIDIIKNTYFAAVNSCNKLSEHHDARGKKTSKSIVPNVIICKNNLGNLCIIGAILFGNGCVRKW